MPCNIFSAKKIVSLCVSIFVTKDTVIGNQQGKFTEQIKERDISGNGKLVLKS